MTTDLKTVNREQLKATVNKVAPQLKENVIFIAGARKIKNNQIEIEFVQHRQLNGRKTSILSLLNQGDERFNSSTGITMRDWLMVNTASLASVFPSVFTPEMVKSLEKALEGIKEGDKTSIIALFKQVTAIRDAKGVDHIMRIRVFETTNVEKLPKSIRETILDGNAPQEYKDRYILQTGGENNERLLDDQGRTIYRVYALAYGRDENDKAIQDDLIGSYTRASEFSKTDTVKSQGNDVLEMANITL